MLNIKFSKWTVIEEVGKDKWGAYLLKCVCDCGNKALIRRSDLVNQKTLQCRSCGYKFKRDKSKLKSVIANKGNNYRHGFSKSKTYDAWCSMRYRCKSKDKNFKWYGSRNITVCDRWMLFKNFLEDMGVAPEGMMLDRINNDLGYFKDNCRWVTPTVSSRNRRNVKSSGFS